MRIKMTRAIVDTTGRYSTTIPAGVELDVVNDKAQKWIAQGWAVSVEPAEIPQPESVKDGPAMQAEAKPRRRRRDK